MKNKIENLNDHLFEAIEMLKNNSDPKASANEKMDLNTAKRIAELGKVIVEGARLQIQALELVSKAQNPIATTEALNQTGVVSINYQPRVLPA